MFQFENPDASLTQQILEEYLNKFKRQLTILSISTQFLTPSCRQNENRRQSLETHVAYLRSNSLVFGLSPHDLVLDGDKLRNIWARRASQFGTRSPSNTNVNAQNMLANRSRSNAPHSPADPDFAHSDLINEVVSLFNTHSLHVTNSWTGRQVTTKASKDYFAIARCRTSTSSRSRGNVCAKI